MHVYFVSKESLGPRTGAESLYFAVVRNRTLVCKLTSGTGQDICLLMRRESQTCAIGGKRDALDFGTAGIVCLDGEYNTDNEYLVG